MSGSSGKTITAQTQRRIWKQLCQFLDWAVYEDDIAEHCFGILKVTTKGQPESYAVLSDNEVVTLLNAQNPQLTPALLFCLLSGMRTGESCGLVTEYLQTRDNLGVFIRARPNRLRSLKSRSAERDVPLHDSLLGLLSTLPSKGALFPSLSVGKITK